MSPPLKTEFVLMRRIKLGNLDIFRMGMITERHMTGMHFWSHSLTSRKGRTDWMDNELFKISSTVRSDDPPG
jgi:hypothetical protein